MSVRNHLVFSLEIPHKLCDLYVVEYALTYFYEYFFPFLLTQFSCDLPDIAFLLCLGATTM